MKNDRLGNQNEKRSDASGEPYFSKVKIAELLIALVGIVLGLLYLYTTAVPLELLLPAYCVFMTAIPILKFIQIRRGERKNISEWLSAFVWIILDIAVIAGTVIYFVKLR